MTSSINKSVNVERRTWDKEAFEARARSRATATASADGTNESNDRGDYDGGINHVVTSSIKKELNPTTEKEEFIPAQQGRAGPMGSQRAFLKARSNKVDLESKLGSTEIIDPAAASATRSKISPDGDIFVKKKENGSGDGALVTHSSGVSKCADGVGWHCRVCDCFLKDSLTYLDHINGRKHQRYLGYTMRVEKSTTTEVSGVLKSLAEKKQDDYFGKNNGASGKSGGDDALNFEDVVRKKDEEALRRKAERARKRDERRRNTREEKSNCIGSIRHELVGENHDDGEEVECATPSGIDNSVEDGDEEEVDEVAGVDPNIAAMMGFSDFSGRRK